MLITMRKQPKQRRSQAMVEAMIDATARILSRDGVDAVTTNRVAEVAGVSVGSLYQYFGHRDELIAAVAERHGQQMLALLTDSMIELASAPLPVAVRSYVTAMMRAHALEPELHRALIQHVMARGLDSMAELDGLVLAAVRGYLELHRHEIVPKDLDAAAWVLVTTVRSLTHMGVVHRPAGLCDAQVVDEVCAIVLRYLLGATPAAAAADTWA